MRTLDRRVREEVVLFLIRRVEARWSIFILLLGVVSGRESERERDAFLCGFGKQK